MNSTKLLTVFAGICLYNIVIGQNLSDVIQQSAPAYKQLKIKTDTYAQYKPHHRAKRYSNILLLSSAPEHITTFAISNFKKFLGAKCFDYFTLFNPEEQYTSHETDSILAANEITAIVKIGWNTDYYNAGTSFYTTFNSYLNATLGSAYNRTGTFCQAYVDFFDLDATSEPFVRVQAMGSAASSGSHKEKSLANGIFANICKGLLRYKIVLGH